ncbi:tail completion protein gp17 [Chondrinema litorale]|uniref:tail completion protein gp17 n=1 Tax=Chondrinema litorale TaxID=2994555 RepID=UPI002543CBA0|nr:DUF3168 domain-containing protein [Chondrinema litorale]UZS00266.1 hypothetical protein OQ292_40710 [Chondrinema litorale]
MIDGVRAILIGDATLTGLVSTKIYPVSAPQKINPPLIVLIRKDADPNKCKTESGGVGRLDEIDFTVLIMSLSYGECETISERIRFLLDGFQGISNSKDLDIEYETEFDSYSEQAKLYVKNATYTAWYKT